MNAPRGTRKKWPYGTCVILFLFAAASQSLSASANISREKGTEKPSIKIAYIGGLTGRNSQASRRSLTALEMLAEHYNANGGLLGKRIQVVPFDNGSVPANNLGIMEKVKNEGVVAITGIHISNDGLLVSNLAEKLHLPTVVASATHPDISRGKEYVVQVCVSDDLIGKSLSDFAKKHLKVKRVVTVTDVSDSASSSVSQAFASEYLKGGEQILKAYKMRSNDVDFKDTVTSIKALPEAQAVLIAASAIESSYLIRQLYEAGVDLPLLGTDNWQNQDLALALKSLNQSRVQAYFSAHWYPTIKNLESKRVSLAYSKYAKPAIGSLDADAALTYDAGLVLFTAMKKANSTNAEAIMRAIRAGSVKGVTGEIRFGPSGLVKNNLFMLTLEKGHMVPISPVKGK